MHFSSFFKKFPLLDPNPVGKLDADPKPQPLLKTVFTLGSSRMTVMFPPLAIGLALRLCLLLTTTTTPRHL